VALAAGRVELRAHTFLSASLAVARWIRSSRLREEPFRCATLVGSSALQSNDVAAPCYDITTTSNNNNDEKQQKSSIFGGSRIRSGPSSSNSATSSVLVVFARLASQQPSVGATIAIVVSPTAFLTSTTTTTMCPNTLCGHVNGTPCLFHHRILLHSTPATSGPRGVAGVGGVSQTGPDGTLMDRLWTL